jgi:excisionase family DNA binding protein
MRQYMQKQKSNRKNGLDLLSIGEASEYLRVSIDTLRRWAKKGRIEALRSPGGHRYFKRTDLDRIFGTKYTRIEKTKGYIRKIRKKDNIFDQDSERAVQSRHTPRFITEELREVKIPPNQPVAIRSHAMNAQQTSASTILIPQIQTTSPTPTTQQLEVNRIHKAVPSTTTETKPKAKESKKIIITVVLITVLLCSFLIFYLYSKSKILSPIP